MKTNEVPELETVTLVDGRRGLRGSLKLETIRETPEGEIDLIASDETVDRYGEVIRLDGWSFENYLRNPVVVDSHNYTSIQFILGRTTDLRVAEGKLRNRVRFADDNPLGALARKLTRAGMIHSQSVGFIPLEFEEGRLPGEPRRTYTRQELLEISLVAIPANPGATIGAALRSGALVAAEVRAALDQMEQFSAAPRDHAGDSVRAGQESQELAALIHQWRATLRRA